MSVNITSTEQIARLRSDLRLGLPVIISEDSTRAVVLSVEACEKNRLEKLLSIKTQKPYLAITSRRAHTLKARIYDKDIARLKLPRDFSLRWLINTSDPTSDLDWPMKGPYNSIRQGKSDVARAAIELCKKTQLLPAAIIIPISKRVSLELRNEGLQETLAHDILKTKNDINILKKISVASLPLKYSKNAKVHVFRDITGLSEHYAIEIGEPNPRDPVLVRLHSACFTGDIIGSLKCDCGLQLDGSMKQISHHKNGLLIYLNQEGRGIGLANKMRAYQLQNQGFDTVEANHRLGFEDEERDLRIGANIILNMGFKSVKLMTNNPKKLQTIESMGLIVEKHIKIQTKPTKENASYLATKASKSGHML